MESPWKPSPELAKKMEAVQLQKKALALLVNYARHFAREQDITYSREDLNQKGGIGAVLLFDEDEDFMIMLSFLKEDAALLSGLLESVGSGTVEIKENVARKSITITMVD